MRWIDRKEKIEELIKSCSTKKCILLKLGLPPNNGNYGILSKYIKIWKLDVSGLKSNKNSITNKQKIPDDLYFSKNTSRSGPDIFKRLIFDKDVEPCCSICGVYDWQGKELTFHVDHIDGDNTNNELENLRVLCPNCHQQTKTWGNKKPKKTKRCENCEKEFIYNDKRRKYCSVECYSINRNKTLKTVNVGRMRISWPPIDLLLKLLKNTNFVSVAKQLNCSDNAIRKHLKRNNINPKTLKSFIPGMSTL